MLSSDQKATAKKKYLVSVPMYALETLFRIISVPTLSFQIMKGRTLYIFSVDIQMLFYRIQGFTSNLKGIHEKCTRKPVNYI